MYDVTKDTLPPSRWRQNVIFAAFAGIAGFYLYAEHKAHLLSALPWLLLLACPLLHVFMHSGHRHGTHRVKHRPSLREDA
jgi:hypothetical protein